MSAEIPYSWRVTTQILLVLLIGWEFASSSRKHYRDLGSFDWLTICFIQSEARSRDPFLERAGHFSGPKEKYEIKTCWIVAQFHAHKPFNFASFLIVSLYHFKVIETLILNANTANIKQLSGPEKLLGLSRNEPQIRVVRRHQHGIFAVVPQT